MNFHPEHDALSGLRDSMTRRAMPHRTFGPGRLAMLGRMVRVERLDDLHPLGLQVGEQTWHNSSFPYQKAKKQLGKESRQTGNEGETGGTQECTEREKDGRIVVEQECQREGRQEGRKDVCMICKTILILSRIIQNGIKCSTEKHAALFFFSFLYILAETKPVSRNP